MSFDEWQQAGSKYDTFLEREADVWRTKGRRPYVVVEGGSDPVGSLGYYAAVPEMLTTWRQSQKSDAPDSVFFALGSGGTHAGLYLGFLANDLDPIDVARSQRVRRCSLLPRARESSPR